MSERKPLVGGVPHDPPIWTSDGYQLDRTGRKIIWDTDYRRYKTFGAPAPECMEMCGGKGFEAVYRDRLAGLKDKKRGDQKAMKLEAG